MVREKSGIIYLFIFVFCSKWQLCHHSIPFGPLFWCQITVKGEKVESEEPLKESSAGKCQKICKLYLIRIE